MAHTDTNEPTFARAWLDRLPVPAAYRHYTVYAVVVLCTSLAGAIIGLAASFLQAPSYVAHASVHVAPQSDQIIGNERTDPSAQPAEAERQLNTLLEILSSRSLADSVANRLKLVGDADFYDAMGASGRAAGAKGQAGLRDLTIDLLDEGLDLTLPNDSRIITASFTSRDANLSARIANSFVEQLISSDLQRRSNSSTYASKYLDDQTAVAKTRLERSQRALNAYARRAGLVRTDDALGSSSNAPDSIVQASIMQVNQSLLQARARRIEAEQKFRESRSVRLLDLPEVMDNPTIQRLLTERSMQEATLSELGERYTSEDLKTAQASARLKQLDRQVNAVGQAVRKGLETDYRTALAEENALEAQMASLKTAGLDEQDHRVRYNILKHEVDKNKDLYDLLLERQREVNAQAGVVANDLSIIDSATPPSEPTGKGRLFAALLGFLVGGALGLVGLVIRDTIKGSGPVAPSTTPIDGPATSRGTTTASSPFVVGEVPFTAALADAPFASIAAFRSAVAPAFAELQRPVLSWLGSVHGKTLLLTGAGRGEGKSTAALAIACLAASEGKRVLVIEANEDSAGYASLVALGTSPFRPASASLDFLVSHTDVAGLDVLPARQLFAQGAPGSVGFEGVLADARQAYDALIIDGAPIGRLRDCMSLACGAQAVLWVERQGVSGDNMAASAALDLSRLGLGVLGKIRSMQAKSFWNGQSAVAGSVLAPRMTVRQGGLSKPRTSVNGRSADADVPAPSAMDAIRRRVRNLENARGQALH